jgi:hypothetical protein
MESPIMNATLAPQSSYANRNGLLMVLVGRVSKACALAAACLSMATMIHAAGPYKELPVKELSSQERSLASNFNRGKIAPSAEATAALKKQTEYFIARLTQESDVQNYTQYRKNLEIMLAERNQTPEARKVIVDTLVQWAGGIAARDTFSPAARVNCTAILSMLDEAPENSRQQLPPRPARGAYNALKGLASTDNMPAEVKAIAMFGLERHMRVYWTVPRVFDDAKKAELQKLATDVIASQPKSALEQVSHAWLVRRAYDMLSAVKAPAAVDVGIAHLSEPTMMPSIRLSALQYLSELDATTFTPEQQKAYLIGMAHFLRSQLVDWYEFEEDIIKRDSNAGAGGMGGMGMGGMGGYGGMEGGMGGMDGGYGEGMGGMMGGEGGEMGGYGGAMGGMGGYGGGEMGGEMGGYGMGGSSSRPKPVDTQDWKTRKSRRLLNMISQQVHVSLDGKPLAEQRVRTLNPLQSVGDAAVLANVQEMITLVDEFQTAINDPKRITKINTLLSAAKLPIENIMFFVLEVPGFAERYPELIDQEEKLDDVPEAPPVDDPNTDPLGGGNNQEGAAPDAGGEGEAGGDN